MLPPGSCSWWCKDLLHEPETNLIPESYMEPSLTYNFIYQCNQPFYRYWLLMIPCCRPCPAPLESQWLQRPGWMIMSRGLKLEFDLGSSPHLGESHPSKARSMVSTCWRSLGQQPQSNFNLWGWKITHDTCSNIFNINSAEELTPETWSVSNIPQGYLPWPKQRTTSLCATGAKWLRGVSSMHNTGNMVYSDSSAR